MNDAQVLFDKGAVEGCVLLFLDISLALTIATLTSFASRILLTCAFCLGFSCRM